MPSKRTKPPSPIWPVSTTTLDLDHLEVSGGSSPQVTLALITYSRELRMGLADAIYWIKSGLDGRTASMATEMATERARLSALLAKDPVLP